MANRIQDKIDRVNEKLKEVAPEKIEALSNTLKADMMELIEYQKLQSVAFACGKLTMEEAQILYQIYGGELPTPERWDKKSLAEKVVGTQTASELAEMRICNIL